MARSRPKPRDLVIRLAVLGVAAVLSCSTLAVPGAPPAEPPPTVQVFPVTVLPTATAAATEKPAATATPADDLPISTPLPTPPPEPTTTPTPRATPDRPAIQKG